MPAHFDSMPLRLRAVLLELEWMGDDADHRLLITALVHQLRRHFADEVRDSSSWLDRRPSEPHRRRIATECQYERVELLGMAEELLEVPDAFELRFRAFLYALARHLVAVESQDIDMRVVSNTRRPRILRRISGTEAA